MKQPAGSYLSKREQQIMELVYQRERLTATEATELLPGSPSNSTVRTLLRILEEKGRLRHVEEDGKYVYLPVRPRQAAARTALQGVVETFFKGSVSDVVAALLTDEAGKISDEELVRLQEMIDKAREEGR
jgi:BlaI family penicillinase repressor